MHWLSAAWLLRGGRPQEQGKHVGTQFQQRPPAHMLVAAFSGVLAGLASVFGAALFRCRPAGVQNDASVEMCPSRKQALESRLPHSSHISLLQSTLQQAPADALFFSLAGVAAGALKQGPLRQREASQYAPPLPQ